MSWWILLAMILVAIAAVAWAAATPEPKPGSEQESGTVESPEAPDPDDSETAFPEAEPVDLTAEVEAVNGDEEGPTIDDDERPRSPVSETTA